MSSHRSYGIARKCVIGLSFIAASLSLTTAAVAADPNANDAYKKERAACMDGSSHQDRATCLREAAAARGEAKRGNLTSSPSYDNNAAQRCSVLPPADRDDCVRRVQGAGTTSGSVEDGGIYRETRTMVPVEPAPPAPAYEPVPVVPPPPAQRY